MDFARHITAGDWKFFSRIRTSELINKGKEFISGIAHRKLGHWKIRIVDLRM